MNRVPLPPPNAEIFTTACDYCIVACGYKVYRWPVGSREGGPKAYQNALGIDRFSRYESPRAVDF
ncbi:MAG: hypothetical protein ABFS56_13010 [Pseudomonadota bacterium]